LNSNKYAVIDIETTGGKATTDRITEVGIVIFENGEITDQFSSLVNPDRSIPPFIVRITGITDNMVKDAPRFYEIAKQIVEMTEDAIFVAHNSSFDYGFIKEEFRQLGYDYTRKTLCTVRLTRKVYPNLKSHSLGNLIKNFNISVKNRHRALDDALATVDILQRILSETKNDHFVDLLLNHGIVPSRLQNGITMELLKSLPESIGIYYLYNPYGHIIYIGKSINIRQRIMQHFSGHTNKNEKIVRSTASISFDLTGSELISLIWESIQIKKHQPEINRALKSTAKYFIYQYLNPDGYINLKIDKNNRKTRVGKDILHFVNSKRTAYGFMQNLREEHFLCDAMCDIDSNKKPCFRNSIKLCFGACTGEETPESYNLRAQSAIDVINKKFEGDQLIIDSGKSPEDFATILIKDGLFYGFQFLNAEILNESSPEEIADMVTAYPDNMQCNGIIKTYLSKHKVKHIIPLESIEDD